MAEFDDSLPAQLAAVREMIFDGQFEEAWIILNRLESMYPESADILALMGDAAMRAGDPEHAWEIYGESLDVDPMWSDLWSARARCSIELCDMKAARSDCQQALLLNSRNAEAHYAAAVIAEFDGRYIEADVNYRTAAQIDSENFPMPFREESDELFEEMVAVAFKQISTECGSGFEDVIVRVEDLPALEEYAETGLSPLATSYLDLPPEQEGVFTTVEPPPTIVIFKRNVERMSRVTEDLRREVEFAIVNELMNLYEEFGEPVPKCLEDRADEELVH